MSYTLGSRYRLSEYLSGGDTGEVWQALDLGTDRAVAVKLLHPHLAADSRLVDRFLRARGELTGLWHPGIARLLDIVVENGTVALITDLVPGTDVRTRLARHGPLTPAEAAEVGATAADALGAAHRIGVVHGDLKPSNVVIPPAGAGPARLTDFSVTLLVRAGMRHADPPVLPPYRAPEVTDGAVPAPSSDVYALGAVLIEMLDGVVRRPDPPDPADDDAATRLRAVAADCLNQHPSGRPSPDEISYELRQLLPYLRSPSPRRTRNALAQAVARIDEPPAGRTPGLTVRAPTEGRGEERPRPAHAGRRALRVPIAIVAVAVIAVGALVASRALRGGSGGEGGSAPSLTAATAPGGAASAGPVPATLPTGATAHTHGGGTEFVRYWFASLNQAQRTGDTRDLAKATSPRCRSCQEALSGIKSAYDSGATLRGGDYIVRRISTNRLWSLERPIYEATFDRIERVVVGSTGSEKVDMPAVTFAVCVAVLEWAGDRWLMFDLPDTGCIT